jgi:hypothetical protein
MFFISCKNFFIFFPNILVSPLSKFLFLFYYVRGNTELYYYLLYIFVSFICKKVSIKLTYNGRIRLNDSITKSLISKLESTSRMIKLLTHIGLSVQASGKKINIWLSEEK